MSKSLKKKFNKSSKPVIGVYPGTFDPVTVGHFDLIERAMAVVGHLVIAVAENPGKGPLFSIEERVAMIEQAIAANKRLQGKSIEVVSFHDLLVKFAKDVDAGVIVRGLRAVSDFEYEFQLTGMNANLDKSIETVFLMSREKHQFISSSFVKEICRLGGKVSRFVPPNVERELKRKFKV